MNALLLPTIFNRQVEPCHGIFTEIARCLKLEKRKKIYDLIFQDTIEYTRSIHFVTNGRPIDTVSEIIWISVENKESNYKCTG